MCEKKVCMWCPWTREERLLIVRERLLALETNEGVKMHRTIDNRNNTRKSWNPSGDDRPSEDRFKDDDNPSFLIPNSQRWFSLVSFFSPFLSLSEENTVSQLCLM